jgi:manganese-dependent ADP-ribose/CDP-alcohol diphosphatase
MNRFCLLVFMCCIFINGCTIPGIFIAREKAETPEFSFGVIADVQYCDCDSNLQVDRHYRASLQKLEECVQDLKTNDLVFVIQVGDFIDQEFTSFDRVLPIYQQLKAPKYHVLGNHDFLVEPEEKGRILEKLGLKKGYYDFTYFSWRFIVLDGNDLSFYVLSETDEKYPEAEAMYQKFSSEGLVNAQTWNGGLSTQQITWLQKTLEKADEAGEKVILFCHFPVFPQPDMHNLWNDSELINILESYKNVVAYMNGHNHAGNYGEKHGIHYLTFQAMVQTPEENAYAVVEVYPDHLKVIGRGREPVRILPIK